MISKINKAKSIQRGFFKMIHIRNTNHISSFLFNLLLAGMVLCSCQEGNTFQMHTCKQNNRDEVENANRLNINQEIQMLRDVYSRRFMPIDHLCNAPLVITELDKINDLALPTEVERLCNSFIHLKAYPKSLDNCLASLTNLNFRAKSSGSLSNLVFACGTAFNIIAEVWSKYHEIYKRFEQINGNAEKDKDKGIQILLDDLEAFYAHHVCPSNGTPTRFRNEQSFNISNGVVLDLPERLIDRVWVTKRGNKHQALDDTVIALTFGQFLDNLKLKPQKNCWKMFKTDGFKKLLNLAKGDKNVFATYLGECITNTKSSKQDFCFVVPDMDILESKRVKRTEVTENGFINGSSTTPFTPFKIASCTIYDTPCDAAPADDDVFYDTPWDSSKSITDVVQHLNNSYYASAIVIKKNGQYKPTPVTQNIQLYIRKLAEQQKDNATLTYAMIKKKTGNKFDIDLVLTAMEQDYNTLHFILKQNLCYQRVVGVGSYSTT